MQREKWGMSGRKEGIKGQEEDRAVQGHICVNVHYLLSSLKWKITSLEWEKSAPSLSLSLDPLRQWAVI